MGGGSPTKILLVLCLYTKYSVSHEDNVFYYCRGSRTQVIPPLFMCDGIPNCPDSSDETFCQGNSYETVLAQATGWKDRHVLIERENLPIPARKQQKEISTRFFTFSAQDHEEGSKIRIKVIFGKFDEHTYYDQMLAIKRGCLLYTSPSPRDS